jgi:uncharacterized protein (TIGR02118 family)
MIKMITLIARKPGITRAQFIDYYERRHAPMSSKLMPQIAKYVRNYPTGTENLHYAGKVHVAHIPYDAVTEHWFEDRAAFDDMMHSFTTDPEKFKAFDEDEEKFIDKTRIVMFLVEVHES